MGTTEDLFTGYAALLDTAGVGRYLTTGAYQTTDTAIVRGNLPQTPDRAIGIRSMPAVASPAGTTATYLTQFLIRGTPNSVSDASNLADLTRDTLLGLTNTQFNGTHVVQVRFSGQVDVGVDDLNRDQWSLKLLADVDEAPTNLRPEGGWD